MLLVHITFNLNGCINWRKMTLAVVAISHFSLLIIIHSTKEQYHASKKLYLCGACHFGLADFQFFWKIKALRCSLPHNQVYLHIWDFVYVRGNPWIPRAYVSVAAYDHMLFCISQLPPMIKNHKENFFYICTLIQLFKLSVSMTIYATKIWFKLLKKIFWE